MIEVEMKAKINDKMEALEKIKEIGGTYSHSEKQHDIYFNSSDKDFKKSDEALRIREIPNGEEFKCILTYKGPKLDSKSKTRKEVEVEIDDTDNMTEILVKLGYKPTAIVNKVRRIFKYEEYTITLDKLNQLGYYMEIEYVAEEDSDIEEIRNNIIEVFKKMDITSGFERTSYLGLLEQLE
ncbi:class IV adenylate cyclase [Methanosphaera sp.]